MYGLNRMGFNKPQCNTRQYGSATLNFDHNSESMPLLKPESLGNDPFKFINNLGLQSHLIKDKQFVDIHSVKPFRSPYPTNYATSPHNMSPIKSLPHIRKRHSTNKDPNKPWHKTSLEFELMEVEEEVLAPTSENVVESPTIVEVYEVGLFEPERKFRLPSECESEDSFIVFDGSLSSLDEDILEDDEESSDEDDDDEFDSVVSSLEDIWPTKRVRFANEKDLCEVHPMVHWSYAYQKARKGPWEQYALDRTRFQRRISDLQLTLNGVLQPEHRNKIYNERFNL